MITPNPSRRVHSGKAAVNGFWLFNAAGSVFRVTGGVNDCSVYMSIDELLTLRGNAVGALTVVDRSKPTPVVEMFKPASVHRRDGRYCDTTTVMASVCSFTTHIQAGMPLIRLIVRLKYPF